MKETEFSVFASKLATYFQGERSPEEFTRTLFEKVYLNSKGDSLLHDMEARTLRGYFYGEHDISNVAKKISSDLDSAYFEKFIDTETDDTINGLCDDFAEECPGIDETNFKQRISERFKQIIHNAAAPKRRTKKKGLTLRSDAIISPSIKEKYGALLVAEERSVCPNDGCCAPLFVNVGGKLGPNYEVTYIDSSMAEESMENMIALCPSCYSRYMAGRTAAQAIDGFDNLVEAVNKHNEVLDDVIIPKIFNTLYEVKSEQKNEDVDVILLKEPKGSGYYEFSADENLVIEKDHNSFTPEEIKKSFHADTYCFDSKPEKECFLQYISSKKVKEIYFTGMFTANQGDLFVQYYDPESKRIRQYYPDFLAKMNDGSYQLIEVKGDNMIDDEVVKAKAEAAEEMSVASGMKYVMYAGSVLMKQNVLEHPPVTYSDEPSPLLMVAEDPVPYGK